MIFSTSVAVDISDLSNHSTDVEISLLFLHVSLSLLKWLPKFIYLQYRYICSGFLVLFPGLPSLIGMAENEDV